MAVRLTRALNVVLLTFIVGVSITSYPDLPKRIPTHFDFRGYADAWSDKTLGSWFTLPGIAVGLTLLMVGLVWLMRRHPRLVNVPDKKKYAALGPTAKQQILAYLEVFVLATNALVLGLFLALLLGTRAVAFGAERLPPATQIVLYGVILVTLVSAPFFVWFIADRMDRLYRRQTIE